MRSGNEEDPLSNAAERRPARQPDFIGIGAQKAGTSWIFSRLRCHPDVVFPGGKEVHFWDMHYERGLDWYFERLGAPPGKTVGDITPAYAILPMNKIQHLASACPDTRFFMILRNPLERAWSLAKMNAAIILEATSNIRFERVAGLAIDDLSDAWWARQFAMKGSRFRGYYDECLGNWLSVVDQDRLLILDYEQLVVAPGDFLTAIAEHCGISVDWLKQQPESFFMEKVFASEERPLPDRLKPLLREIYAESIENLSVRLGRDYSHWLD